MFNVLKEKFKSKLIAQGVQPPRKESATVLFKANIRLLRVINTHDGFLTIIQNNKQAKKIFSNDSKEKQNFLGFTLVLPLEMRARLTLMLKKTRKTSDYRRLGKHKTGNHDSLTKQHGGRYFHYEEKMHNENKIFDSHSI